MIFEYIIGIKTTNKKQEVKKDAEEIENTREMFTTKVSLRSETMKFWENKKRITRKFHSLQLDKIKKKI